MQPEIQYEIPRTYEENREEDLSRYGKLYVKQRYINLLVLPWLMSLFLISNLYLLYLVIAAGAIFFIGNFAIFVQKAEAIPLKYWDMPLDLSPSGLRQGIRVFAFIILTTGGVLLVVYVAIRYFRV